MLGICVCLNKQFFMLSIRTVEFGTEIRKFQFTKTIKYIFIGVIQQHSIFV